MKVSIIAFSDIKKCPYINPYASFCKDNSLDFEVVYFNRSGEEQSADYPLVEVKWNKSAKKWKNFLSFRKTVIKHLKSTKPDFIIVLTTMPAVLLGGYLRKHYKGRYLVDVRDYTYERFLPYYWIEKRAIKNSAMTVISSPGFKNFLPEGDYVLCHNANPLYREKSENVFKPREDKGLTIAYVGTISYKSNCRKLIDLVLKDERFNLYFYGDENGEKQITDYTASLGCDRIKAFGAYAPSEKIDIMRSVDILFNIYGNGTALVKYALSNKLYDSFYMQLPLLTSPKTSMSEEAGAYSFDLDLDKADSLDALYDWYYSIDGEAFKEYANAYLARVFADQDEFYNRLKKTILGN